MCTLPILSIFIRVLPRSHCPHCPRHRIFVFLWVLIATFFISIEVAAGGHSWWWSVCVTCGIVLPLACYFKSALPRLSKKVNEKIPFSKLLRIEEILLLGFLILCLIQIALAGDRAESAAQQWGGAWAAALVAEAMSLVWKYLFCRICCSCCLPRRYQEFTGGASGMLDVDNPSGGGTGTYEGPKPADTAAAYEEGHI